MKYDCGIKQHKGTVFIGTNINYKLFTYCIKNLVGDYM